MPSEKLPKDFHVRIYRRTAEESALLLVLSIFLYCRQQLSGAVPLSNFRYLYHLGRIFLPFIFLATDLTVRIFGAPWRDGLFFG